MNLFDNHWHIWGKGNLKNHKTMFDVASGNLIFSQLKNKIKLIEVV